ncbi:MAG TPA: dihydropyrimidinase, partial [Gammaproteobacteria bacterium]|nr:dihydropyrimidinase [Gammaproteobacteria bacterium]
MKHFDTVIRGGTVVTAADSTDCDVGIIDGRVAALGLGFSDADRVIDATGKLVLPGGVEGHCHIEQQSSVGGVMSADDFFTGT